MLRELNENEMEMVSGGVVSFTDGTAQNHNGKLDRLLAAEGTVYISDDGGSFGQMGTGSIGDGDGGTATPTENEKQVDESCSGVHAHTELDADIAGGVAGWIVGLGCTAGYASGILTSGTSTVVTGAICGAASITTGIVVSEVIPVEPNCNDTGI